MKELQQYSSVRSVLRTNRVIATPTSLTSYHGCSTHESMQISMRVSLLSPLCWNSLLETCGYLKRSTSSLHGNEGPCVAYNNQSTWRKLFVYMHRIKVTIVEAKRKASAERVIDLKYFRSSNYIAARLLCGNKDTGFCLHFMLRLFIIKDMSLNASCVIQVSLIPDFLMWPICQKVYTFSHESEWNGILTTEYGAGQSPG